MNLKIIFYSKFQQTNIANLMLVLWWFPFAFRFINAGSGSAISDKQSNARCHYNPDGTWDARSGFNTDVVFMLYHTSLSENCTAATSYNYSSPLPSLSIIVNNCVVVFTFFFFFFLRALPEQFGSFNFNVLVVDVIWFVCQLCLLWAVDNPHKTQ